MKGTGFSPYINNVKLSGALAPEGNIFQTDPLPDIWKLTYLRPVHVQQCATALAKAGHDGAIKVNLPVDSHQQLHRFHLRVVRSQRSPCMHELVAQILDRMAKGTLAVILSDRSEATGVEGPAF